MKKKALRSRTLGPTKEAVTRKFAPHLFMASRAHTRTKSILAKQEDL
jgi:hypothetical protein